MRRGAGAFLGLLVPLLGGARVRATLITSVDGSVQRIESTTRKHFGRRHVEVDVTGAPLVLVENTDHLERRPEYAGAVILLRERPPWCDAHEYRTLLKSGALAVVREFYYFVPGRFYYLREPNGVYTTNRRAQLPWLDVAAADWDAIAAAFDRNASVTLASTPNPWVATYRSRAWMLHRVVILLTGIVSGLISAANFARRGFTFVQALSEPTIVSTVLLIEGCVCPVLGVSCFFCHGGLFHTDAFPFTLQRVCMTLFCGWGLFTTKLMAMHWREVCREITDSAPRANLWAEHKCEIYSTFAATVGVDTAFVAVFASAESHHWRNQREFKSMIDAGIAIYASVQTIFALQFLYAAYLMRSDVLLALRRKLRAISIVRNHITQLGVWLALSGVFMIMFVVGCIVGFVENKYDLNAWVLGARASARSAPVLARATRKVRALMPPSSHVQLCTHASAHRSRRSCRSSPSRVRLSLTRCSSAGARRPRRSVRAACCRGGCCSTARSTVSRASRPNSAPTSSERRRPDTEELSCPRSGSSRTATSLPKRRSRAAARPTVATTATRAPSNRPATALSRGRCAAHVRL